MEKEEWKGKIEDSFLHPVLQNSGSSMEMLQVLYGDVPGLGGGEAATLALCPTRGFYFYLLSYFSPCGIWGEEKILWLINV